MDIKQEIIRLLSTKDERETLLNLLDKFEIEIHTKIKNSQQYEIVKNLNELLEKTPNDIDKINNHQLTKNESIRLSIYTSLINKTHITNLNKNRAPDIAELTNLLTNAFIENCTDAQD
jgi:hypothetical protein